MKSPDAFECLWAYREEMGKHPKKEAVSLIAAIPGLTHLKTNTIKSNITPIPFLLGEFKGESSEDFGEKEKETELLRVEIASLRAELDKEKALEKNRLGEKEEETESLRLRLQA